jgi:hypothetical protein
LELVTFLGLDGIADMDVGDDGGSGECPVTRGDFARASRRYFNFSARWTSCKILGSSCDKSYSSEKVLSPAQSNSLLSAEVPVLTVCILLLVEFPASAETTLRLPLLLPSFEVQFGSTIDFELL